MRRLLLGLALSAIACTKTEPPQAGRIDASGSDVRAEDYPHVLASWTRDNRLYNGLENKVFVTAVFMTPELRTAVRTTYPDVVGHGGIITRDELSIASADSHTFFISMYTADRKWNDLQAPTSIWKLTMQSEGGEVAPTTILRVKQDENLRTVFPIIGRYDECYLVRFPVGTSEQALITTDTTNARLRFASGLGETLLDWQLVRGSAPVPTTGEPPLPPAVR